MFSNVNDKNFFGILGKIRVTRKKILAINKGCGNGGLHSVLSVLIIFAGKEAEKNYVRIKSKKGKIIATAV